MSWYGHFLCWTLPSAVRVLLLYLVTSHGTTVDGAQISVCPQPDSHSDCDFNGDSGIQEAVDQAASGDTILVRAGEYSPRAHRDVAYRELVIPGYVVVDGKSLGFVGESGTILDGSAGDPTTAFVIHRGAATIDNFEIRNFRVQLAEDDRYDGHGIFVIDGKTTIRNTELANIEKMSITIMGSGDVSVTNVQIVDGHVGIWATENATLRVWNSLFRNNDSAGIAAYVSSTTEVRNAVFDGNLDDGIYAEDEAVIDASNSLFVRNKPYAIRGVDDTQIFSNFNIFHDNEDNFSTYSDTGQIRTGQHNSDVDPKIGNDYRPLGGSPLIDNGDPEVLDIDGSVSDIGLYGGPKSIDVLPTK